MKVLALVAAVALLSACGGKQDQYYWGSYEKLVYLHHIQPGDAPAEVQIDLLLQDKAEAVNAGLKVPPGLNAHLGMMYAQVGNADAALAALEEEKQAFPDSAKFINDTIERIKGAAK